MPQSLSNILLHLIFSTKDRHPWLDHRIREKTHAFLAGAVRQCDCEAYRVGGVADHVHLAVRISRTLSVADLVKEIKTSSSKWVKTQDASLHDFAWHHVSLFFLSLPDAETAIARVAERVRQGGHDIPEAVIRRRFAAGLQNFHVAYKSGVDAWALFDNVGETPALLELEENK